jgi:hypothetical protein
VEPAQSAQVNFVRQQGFRDAGPSCGFQYGALMWQPRVIGIIVAAALIGHALGYASMAARVFLALSAVLLWNALAPKFNVFDTLYNALMALPPARPRLTPAPGPRRFAQAMAGTIMLGIGLSLMNGWAIAAYALVWFLLIALSSLIFGKLCLGSYIFHLAIGQSRFANRTLPWSRT